ncbi:MAG: cyclic GMP-AMP synthase DncV-like nucleotidyltransferase [Ekhidna sp.]|uniref:SMODS domain-containing nucleotidyltransferase n=1 Tax=Ekhidna sp. TaxID=2608089 RepID=UPI00329A119F
MSNKGIENLIALGFLTLLGGLVYTATRKKFEITQDSNSDDLLKRFNKLIDIHPDKVANLQRAHETIRNKIKSYFYNNTNLPIPEFYIQGSYKMKTVVENRNIKCDVDLAVIFPEYPGVKLETLQNHVRNALWNHTTKGVVNKAPCVRLTYVRDFHIDLPIYFKDRNGKMYFGSRGNDWQPSDPKAFVEWFKKKTDNRPQLIRIIRYLKAWADHTKTKSGIKFPSGLALSLWAIDHYKSSSRDDVALFNTCSGILNYLKENFKYQWQAKMPVAPFDNVLSKLSGSQKSAFYNELKEMVFLMTEAVSASSKSKARPKWNRIFGNRFRSIA